MEACRPERQPRERSRGDIRARFEALRGMLLKEPSCAAGCETSNTVKGMLALCDEVLRDEAECTPSPSAPPSLGVNSAEGTPEPLPLPPEHPHSGPLGAALEARQRQIEQRFPSRTSGVAVASASPAALACPDCDERIVHGHLRLHRELAHQMGTWALPLESGACPDCTDDGPCSRAQEVLG